MPYLVTKLIEFFIPLFGVSLSKAVSHGAGFIGGLLLTNIATLLYPVSYLVNKSIELYGIIREKIRHGVAIVYGKTGSKPTLSTDENDIFSNETLHSLRFRKEVVDASNSTFTTLLFDKPTTPKAPESTNNIYSTERQSPIPFFGKKPSDIAVEPSINDVWDPKSSPFG